MDVDLPITPADVVYRARGDDRDSFGTSLLTLLQRQTGLLELAGFTPRTNLAWTVPSDRPAAVARQLTEVLHPATVACLPIRIVGRPGTGPAQRLTCEPFVTQVADLLGDGGTPIEWATDDALGWVDGPTLDDVGKRYLQVRQGVLTRATFQLTSATLQRTVSVHSQAQAVLAAWPNPPAAGMQNLPAAVPSPATRALVELACAVDDDSFQLDVLTCALERYGLDGVHSLAAG